MPCLIVILLLGFPRLALLAIWLLTTWTRQAFETTLWPILGFLFFPYTTLSYMWAAIQTGHHIDGGWVFVVVIGVLLDLGAMGSAKRRKRKRRR
ncbi:MAG TPA: hypothetical protein VIM11_28505 [Tepidisphaeraceae bacterium]|jgi:thiol:disulfide interchange protein